MANSLETVVGIGLIVLVVAFLFPMVAGTIADDEAVSDHDMAVEETVTPTAGLEVTLDAVTAANATVTVAIDDEPTSETQTIDENETGTFELETDTTETVNVTVDSVDADAETSRLTVAHSDTFGWHPVAKALFEHYLLLFVVVGFIVVAGVMMAVIQ